MTKSKYKFGPWFYSLNPEKTRFFVEDAGYRPIAYIAGIGPDDEANARLISAAPDLLIALEAAVESGMVPVSSVSDGGASKYSRQVQVADLIRTAIVKARGKI